MPTSRLIPPPSVVEAIRRLGGGSMFSPRISADAEPETPLAKVIVLRTAGIRELDPAGSADRSAASNQPDVDDAAAAGGAVGSVPVGAPVSAVSRQSVYGQPLTAGSSALAPAPAEELAPRPRHLTVAPDPEASAGGQYGSIPRVAVQSVESGLAAMGLRARSAGRGPAEPEPEVEAEPEFEPAPGEKGQSVLYDPQFAPVSRPARPLTRGEERLGVRFSPTAPPASVTPSTAPTTAPIPDPAPSPAPTPAFDAAPPAFDLAAFQPPRFEPSPPPAAFEPPSNLSGFELPPTRAEFDPRPTPTAFELPSNLAAFEPPPTPAAFVAPPAAPMPSVDPTAHEIPGADPAEDPREILRAATQKAVDRLLRPEPVVPAPTPAAAASPAAALAPVEPAPGAEPALSAQPAASAEPAPSAEPASPDTPAPAPSARPSIAELTRQVERAVNHAALAESYQREFAEQARALAAQILADAVTEAQHTTDRAATERESVLAAAQAEAEKLLSDSRAAAEQLVSDGQAAHDERIARAESQSRSIIAHAELELGRRIRRIAEVTDAITDVAEATLGRLASGTLTGTQLAQFITTLGTVTERALEHLQQAEPADRAPNAATTPAGPTPGGLVP